MIADGVIKPIRPQKIYSFADVVDAFREMCSGNHVGKIVLADGHNRACQLPVRMAVPQLKFDPNAAYIMVGGLRGLCGSIAMLLAQHGARHLITLSRSEQRDKRTQYILSNLRSFGAEVCQIQGDVSKAEDVERLFKSSSYPIAGIIQGAMVLKDRTFASMTIEDWQECTKCKVHGAWNLHNASLRFMSRQGFFVLLSSISGIVGRLSQANYAAANTFLDAFANYRQRLGLRACSIDLGAIEDVGYLSERTELAERIDTPGFSGINEHQLHSIIYLAILQQMHKSSFGPLPSEIITGLVIPQPSDSSLQHDVRFAPIFDISSSDDAARDDRSGGSQGHAQAFMTLAKAETNRTTLHGAAVKLVSSRLMKLLRLSEPIEAERPLSGYGIDSLTAVEFRNWMRTELGIEVTTIDIIGAKTLNAFCEGLVARLLANREQEVSALGSTNLERAC
ncbi:MAG: putative secondary metabolism biosynthetic enzyme [Bathelium mastoideum]|nr:MAG: putative secondary metabolism biosynthetic enzyme [Bathelium mastoideum]